MWCGHLSYVVFNNILWRIFVVAAFGFKVFINVFDSVHGFAKGKFLLNRLKHLRDVLICQVSSLTNRHESINIHLVNVFYSGID